MDFSSSNIEESFHFEEEGQNKVTYTLEDIKAKEEGHIEYEGSKEYIREKISKAISLQIMKTAERDLSYLCVVNQCFQKIHGSHLSLNQVSNTENIYVYEALYSKKLLLVIKVRSDKRQEAKKKVAEIALKYFFPSIHNSVSSIFEILAKRKVDLKEEDLAELAKRQEIKTS